MGHIPNPGDLALDLIRSRDVDDNKNNYWYRNALKIFPIACQDITNVERKNVKDLLDKIGNLSLPQAQRRNHLNKCVQLLLNITGEFLSGKRETKNEYFLVHRVLDKLDNTQK